MASSLESHLGYWLRFVSNHVSYSFARKLEGQGVTVAEWVVLRQMFDLVEASPSQIAERMEMTRGAISKLVERLVGKGLVRRESSASDRRYQTVSLTETGRQLVPRLASLADENEAEFFDCLEPAQRVQLESILRELVERNHLKSPPVD